MKLRFTIRDLLLVMIIAALAVGWWLDSSASHRQLEAATAKLNEVKMQAAKDSADLAAIYQQKSSLAVRHEADLKEIERLRGLLPTTP